MRDYAKDHVAWLRGTYIQQSFQINGKSCWFQVDGSGAIWFEKGGHWIVGPRSRGNLGSNFGYIFDYESTKTLCPNYAKKWQIKNTNASWVPVSSHEVDIQKLTGFIAFLKLLDYNEVRGLEI